MRGLWITSVIFLLIGAILLVGGMTSAEDNGLLWYNAHGAAMLVGSILIGTEALHMSTLARFRKAPSKDRAILLTTLYSVGAAAITIGWLLGPTDILALLVLFGWAVLVAASIVSLATHLDLLPKRKQSVVDERRPLTKGDDASWKHVRFAHFFLPIGLALIAIAFFPLFSDMSWVQGLRTGGLHILGIGYGLLSMYGLGHLWVPRFSGVPAIAAGAIKGELYSTLPALILLPMGFALDMRALLIAGGAFAFLGFFTYMGVLGANIMRNKSPTHRVTTEFVYIPWTFTGIFWLVSGVLMGIFLNVVPDMLAPWAEGLRAVHVHINIFGGILQLIMGWLTRIAPGKRDPPRFSGAMSGSFYAFNTALVAALFYLVGSSPVAGAFAVIMLVAAFWFYMWSMKEFIRRRLVREA